MAGDRIRAGDAVFYKRAGRRNLLDLAPTVMIRRRRPRFVIAYKPMKIKFVIFFLATYHFRNRE